MNKPKMFTIGADPEMFVRPLPVSKGPGIEVKQDITPICGKVGGTKKKPLPFLRKDGGAIEGYYYQEDNVAFEVNIPPTTNSRDFAHSIDGVLRLSRDLLKSKGLEIDITKSAHRFSVANLSHPYAQTIGCDPDKSAYGGLDDNPIDREPFEIKDLGTWRFTGGHIHLGYDKEHIEIPEHVIVRLMDACVYLPLIHKDKQKMRRPKYGLAGLYRSKPYGLEYRTMSNFWLDDPYSVAIRTFNLLNDVYHNAEHLFEFYMEMDNEEVRKCIDEGGDGSRTLWKKLTKLPKFRELNISNNGPPSTKSGHTFFINTPTTQAG